jgi:hypothetical protein
MDNLPVNKAALAGVALACGLLFIVWWPLAVIWCLNTLFRADIPYNFSTWCATVLLVSVIKVSTLSPEKR